MEKSKGILFGLTLSIFAPAITLFNPDIAQAECGPVCQAIKLGLNNSNCDGNPSTDADQTERTIFEQQIKYENEKNDRWKTHKETSTNLESEIAKKKKEIDTLNADIAKIEIEIKNKKTKPATRAEFADSLAKQTAELAKLEGDLKTHNDTVSKIEGEKKLKSLQALREKIICSAVKRSLNSPSCTSYMGSMSSSIQPDDLLGKEAFELLCQGWKFASLKSYESQLIKPNDTQAFIAGCKHSPIPSRDLVIKNARNDSRLASDTETTKYDEKIRDLRTKIQSRSYNDQVTLENILRSFCVGYAGYHHEKQKEDFEKEKEKYAQKLSTPCKPNTPGPLDPQAKVLNSVGSAVEMSLSNGSPRNPSSRSASSSSSNSGSNPASASNSPSGSPRDLSKPMPAPVFKPVTVNSNTNSSSSSNGGSREPSPRTGVAAPPPPKLVLPAELALRAGSTSSTNSSNNATTKPSEKPAPGGWAATPASAPASQQNPPTAPQASCGTYCKAIQSGIKSKTCDEPIPFQKPGAEKATLEISQVAEYMLCRAVIQRKKKDCKTPDNIPENIRNDMDRGTLAFKAICGDTNVDLNINSALAHCLTPEKYEPNWKENISKKLGKSLGKYIQGSKGSDEAKDTANIIKSFCTGYHEHIYTGGSPLGD